MLDTIEFILKILFLILSIVWIGKIMVLRSDKQIVINPLLIGISAILSVLPHHSNTELQSTRIILYILYLLVVCLGLYTMRRKNGIF
ncbi:MULTISPECIES: hypothetical protein [Romboutsia]|uniref:Uncharacterized protein n=1 Tax=Romboutsia hominis TaxID=1507512 RepID=A0A2P2BR66_9FIRM|nr:MULTISPECIES: hypothetical protein [Romboutsia]MCH1960207.1 hypothetical protein [Romboutsia hominis]MCH1969358.1 hypothetical protein [Romboutsia hominis]MDB8791775.1 hypothetical protein [Romboutsia sp. 1001216sp1]MDB8794102.1 hypothetical protein [Romboutsia sp. 1001216sp1]MDB8796352.1 hypothetical protein [Romboutsia sp. 1001216sp1]